MTRLPRSLSTALVSLALAAAVAAPAQAGEPAETLRRHVAFLASEELEGRMTGSEGAARAADYLAAELERLGFRPLPGQESFELPFEFTAGTRDAGSTLTASGEPPVVWSSTDAVQALSFSDSATVRGSVVFAGYGLVVPESQEFGYDSYATLDVEDKIVLVLRYFPEGVDQETRARLARYSGLRYKALQARERGAKALLLVTGPASPNAGETVPMTFDTAISGSGIVAASISGAVAEEIFRHVPDADLAAAQSALDDGNPHVTGFEIPGLELELSVEVARETRTARNVVGYLPRTAAGAAIDKPYVVLGAHYDHLGRGDSGNSLAGKEEAGGIHYGADDNASGVAATLEAARRLAAGERSRDLVVAFWSGEELGVLGSSRFVREGPLPTGEIAAYVNLDMVGRMRDNKLTVQAAGSSDVWPGIVERANVPVGFDLAVSDDPYLPTDSSSFNQAEVPTLNLFTGSHEDYHRPSDRAEKINYDDLERVARFGALVTARVANAGEAPGFVKVAPRREQGGSRDTVRAYTGTIPDYSTEVEGLLLSGVIEGGPADEAGLREGDVVVEFGGQTIANIYDYTYALDAVKIGVEIRVAVLRDGERLELTITPRARD